MADVRHCQAPGCGRPLRPSGSGRPPKYCNANCRKRAQRALDRELAAAQERADRLDAARATIRQSRRELTAATRRATSLMAAILAHAGDDNSLPLLALLADWDATVHAIDHHARTLSDATARAKNLARTTELQDRRGRAAERPSSVTKHPPECHSPGVAWRRAGTPARLRARSHLR